jgi:hypothetical protein
MLCLNLINIVINFYFFSTDGDVIAIPEDHIFCEPQKGDVVKVAANLQDKSVQILSISGEIWEDVIRKPKGMFFSSPPPYM